MSVTHDNVLDMQEYLSSRGRDVQPKAIRAFLESTEPDPMIARLRVYAARLEELVRISARPSDGDAIPVAVDTVIGIMRDILQPGDLGESVR